jgi:hypothetical protein
VSIGGIWAQFIYLFLYIKLPPLLWGVFIFSHASKPQAQTMDHRLGLRYQTALLPFGTSFFFI